MNLQEFEQIVKTEKSALSYLRELCSSTDKQKCLKCGCGKLYDIEKGRRRRCSRCGYTFHQFTGRWIDRCKIGAREWLWIVKLFELETPATVIASETGISYPTVLKAVTALRMSIAGHLNGNGNCKARYPGTVGRRVFGIIGNGEDEELEVVPEEQIFLLTDIEDDYLILIEGAARYDSLLCDDRKVRKADHGGDYLSYRAYCSINGFWQYTKEKLVKYHGVSCCRLPLYLKEIEFRWMNKNGKYFERVTESLCDYMPESLIHICESEEILQ